MVKKRKLLPEQIKMTRTLFADGAKGAKMQGAVNMEYGIAYTATCEKHGAPWVQTFAADCLPGRVFGTYRELREAYNEL